MKKLLKAFLPPGIIAVPVILLAVVAAVLPSDNLTEHMQNANLWGMIAVTATAVAMIFFLPTTVAALRDAPSYIGVLIVNIVGGPFLIGWIAALIWAFVDRKPTPAVIQNIYQSPPPPPE